MENPIKIDDLGVLLFLETPISLVFCAKKNPCPSLPILFWAFLVKPGVFVTYAIKDLLVYNAPWRHHNSAYKPIGSMGLVYLPMYATPNSEPIEIHGTGTWQPLGPRD